MADERLILRRLEVRHDRIIATVQVDPAHPNTTPQLASRAVERLPDLPRHACVNSRGDLFGAVIARTSIPHLFEHVVIDLQTRACAADPDRIFTGVTRWSDRAQGIATVEVSYRDDVEAIRAFRDAANLVNALG